MAGNRKVVKKLARRGGRPSRETAALLQDRILDIATELFLAEGYGETTIELVAGALAYPSGPSIIGLLTRLHWSVPSCIASLDVCDRRMFPAFSSGAV